MSIGQIGDSKLLMEQSGLSTMQALGFDSCQISLTCWRLLKLIHDIMKEACSCTNIHNAHLLYYSSRDCLHLFFTIIPIKFDSNIYHNPRIGAIFYNDCTYLAHNCTLLTFKYRNEIKDVTLKDNIGYIDFISKFRYLFFSIKIIHYID